MVLVLMVAEKPSLALSISNILSGNKCSSRKGFNGACSIHEWTSTFMKETGIRFRMTSVCGHILSTDFPSKYNNWEKIDPLDLFQCPIEKKEATPKLKMPAFLASEAKNIDRLVLWLDCDKEGENICFEVINSIKNGNAAKRDLKIYRAKFSSVTEKDIRFAFDNLVEPNENQSRSVDARQELDLRIGCAFTRFQTKFFQGKYGDLDSSVISYGPCQTPTLGFCVARHDQITGFKPESFWVLQAWIELSSGASSTVLFWERSRCFDKEVALMFLHQIRSVKSPLMATVISVTSKEKAKEKPLALNTVELMRVASSGLGVSPHHAMQIAERLYMAGFISYPRTESTHYSDNFDLKDVLRQQKNSEDWGKEVRDLLNSGLSIRGRKGHDAGDHPPITPTKAASRENLDGGGGDLWRIYEYITRHFIASVSRNCRYSIRTATFDVGGEKFSLSSKNIIEPGFTSVMSWEAPNTECEEVEASNIQFDLKVGDTFKTLNVKLCDKETSPPDYLTESDLITKMEKHGIGTDASIPTHINNICQRNYVKVEGKSRRLIPTPLGIVLVHGYLKIDPDLVQPQMRSALERQLELIALGKADFHSVLKHTLEIFRRKFTYFMATILDMDQLFEVSFSTLADSGKPISRCGKCRRYMKYIQAKPSRLYCQQCDETYSVPSVGTLRIHQELKCPLDDFELIYCYNGVRGKSFVFCPFCYNYSPFPDMEKASPCHSCTHKTCIHSQMNLGVSLCVACPKGVLALDSASGPKWKLICSHCHIIVRLFEEATKLSVLSQEMCPKCDAQIMRIEYKEGKSRLKNDSDGTQVLSVEGCIFCHEDLRPLVEQHQAVFQRISHSGNVRNSKRGGRSRGKGGGSGNRRAPKDKMSHLANYFV